MDKNNLESLVVFALPSNNETNKLLGIINKVKRHLQENNIPFNDVYNIPHNTIYQGLFDDKGLGKLDQEIKQMANNHKKHTVKMKHPIYLMHSVHLFFDIVVSEQLQRMYDYIFENKIFELRSPGLIKPIENAKHLLNKSHLQIVNKYGCLFNTPEFGFNPHFTLIYDIKIASFQVEFVNFGQDLSEVTFDKIGIGQVGDHGNLTKIISIYDLQ